MSGKPLVELHSVTKVYAGRPAVDNVTLDLFPGEFVAVTGPSGSGKSTLARILVGLTTPTSGEFLYKGEKPEGRDALVRLAGRRQIVFQNPFRSLNPRFTVAQIVAEPAEIVGTSVDPGALLDRVGLSRAVLDRRPRTLSGGECQRVAVARALSTDPELLVLDEPDSDLDPIAAAGILRIIIGSAKTRCVLVVSHNPLALNAAGRILTFNASRLLTAPASAAFHP